jgi:excisionase family DNA binding protein
MKKHAKRASLPPADALFLTRREAAALLRVHLGAIDEMIRREKLPAYRPVGRRILIRREELLRVVAESPVWEASRDEQ